MKKLGSTLPNMFLSLTIICVVASALLSFVYNGTKDIIAQSKVAALERAIGEVTPEFDNSPYQEQVKILVETDSLSVFPATKDGALVATAVQSVTHKGFSGDVSILFGFDLEGNIINYSVLSMQETPGLGTKMTDWFKTEKGNQSVLGRNLNNGDLKVKQDQGDVDAITAATISSRAFLDAAARAHIAQKEFVASRNSAPSPSTESEQE
ncbi:electron transporter RnfG [Porphyromonas canoris]|uniref:RnfABCDGE type electron transport complex subunit G n=1 Tax=Porphyromonas TaxID=836 RepID=UPI00051D2517|nr:MULTISPECIES: RnfABCDGE type electron transport complex subunit G [Porphyromonas]KGL53624.1 electron transporter RnfG [Porphyromonas canoris]KGN95123.1 electron transporter RnfG [Porphyromonas sp. COT-108 OH2963]